jgi:hypothetical protein
MATTIKPMAGPLTCSAPAELGAGMLGMTGTVPDEAAANSGRSPIAFHSVAPSGKTLVCRLARPSVIHWRNCSGVTGPYSF